MRFHTGHHPSSHASIFCLSGLQISPSIFTLWKQLKTGVLETRLDCTPLIPCSGITARGKRDERGWKPTEVFWLLVHHTNLSAQLVHRHRYTHNSIHQLAGFYTYAQNRQHVYILTSVALIATTKYNLITRGLYFSNTAISRTATQTYSHTHFLTHPQTVRGTNTYNFFLACVSITIAASFRS